MRLKMPKLAALALFQEDEEGRKGGEEAEKNGDAEKDTKGVDEGTGEGGKAGATACIDCCKASE